MVGIGSGHAIRRALGRPLGRPYAVPSDPPVVDPRVARAIPSQKLAPGGWRLAALRLPKEAPMSDKTTLVALLHQAGVMLEVLDPDSFRARAYYTAARALETSSLSLSDLIEGRAALKIKGIGKSLFSQMMEFNQTGSLPVIDELAVHWPEGLWDLLRLPGIGPKRVSALYHHLHITSLGELEYACNENRLVTLTGFGPKTQSKIVESIEVLKEQQGKRLYAEVESLAEELTQHFKALPGVLDCVIVGDFRRQCPIVERLDFLLQSQGEVAGLSSLPGINREEDLTPYLTSLYTGEVKGMPINIFVCDSSWSGTALIHLTGSAAHLEALGMESLVPQASEEDYYNYLGLPFIHPSLREGQGEVELSRSGHLPALLEQRDIAGLLHIHSTYSDGSASIMELAKAARGMGHAYLGIADHSRSAVYANGLSIDRVKAQLAEIDGLNASGTLGALRVLKGIEVDILADGSLDYPDEVLSQFDFCIASVHSQFRMGVDQMTKRIVKAIANPHIDIIGHLTGRLLLGRSGYTLDMDAIIEACAQHNTALELNASPRRLDLSWEHCRQAKSRGVRIAINPDSHHISTLTDIRYGHLVAQKAGITAGDMYVPLV